VTKQSAAGRHCEYPFRTATERVMTLIEECDYEAATKQSAAGRHCE
jgi:hypothetical protein